MFQHLSMIQYLSRLWVTVFTKGVAPSDYGLLGLRIATKLRIANGLRNAWISPKMRIRRFTED